MKFHDLIGMANSSLWRNKLRTFLTILAIFIGSTTLSLTSGIGSGLKSYLQNQLGNLGTSNSMVITANVKKTTINSSSALTPYNPNQKNIVLSRGGGPSESIVALASKDITKISKIPNIVSVQPIYNIAPDFIATTSNPNKKFKFSISQAFGTPALDIAAGRNVINTNNTPEITIPESYTSSLGFSTYNAAVNQMVNIGISNSLGQQTVVEAKIVGVQQKNLIGSTLSYGNNKLTSILESISAVGEPVSQLNNYISLSAIFNPNLTTNQINALKKALLNEGYKGLTIKDQENTIFTVINAVTGVLIFFAIITLVAASFGIINTLFMSVQERTREIGIMKALGLSKAKIFMLFSFEALLIGFWGSLIGIFFANGLGNIINSILSKGLLKDFPGLNLLSFPIKTSLIIVVSIMVIAFIAGTLPARRASNKDPIEALRYE